MIEAMTEGGFRKRGLLFTPQDALSSDAVILEYLRSYLEGIEVLEDGKNYTVGEVNFSIPARQLHQVETYGVYLRFTTSLGPVSCLSTWHVSGASYFATWKN